MFLLIVILLVVLALGGFGHTGYRRGWYGGAGPVSGGPAWGGGLLGFLLLILVLFLVFGGGHSYFAPGAVVIQ